jgi:hypothetical protein
MLPEAISGYGRLATPIRMPGISWCKRRNMPAHARASGLEPGGPASPHRRAKRSSHSVFAA